jgi:hypothetical protein
MIRNRKIDPRGRGRNLPGLLLAAVVLAAASAGCRGTDGEGSATPAAAGFEYSVTGDVERTIRGPDAAAGIESIAQVGEVWSLDLSGGEGNENGSLALISKAGPPSSGTHALSDAETPAELEDGELGLFLVIAGAEPGARFIGAASSGEVTLEPDEAGTSGSLKATAKGMVYPEGEAGATGSLNISGSFRTRAPE